MERKLNKKFFKNHPISSMSAFQIQYYNYVEGGIEDIVEILESGRMGMAVEDSKDLEKINLMTDPEELVNYMRKNNSIYVKYKLGLKILENEKETIGLIKKRAMTSVQDFFIESATSFFLRNQENCCEWILDHYDTFRSEYLKAMLCLVLGFRGDSTMVPFLMNEVERFEREYPEEEYKQGPLIALGELSLRFHLIK
ncbi:MAG: hypothetical protein Q4G11_04025 [Gallicola sp.]|nr:hypothetical protein [Gallicola sp.]